MRTEVAKRLGIFCPIFEFPCDHPDERWGMITDQAVPGIKEGYYISNYGKVLSTRKGITVMATTLSFDGYPRLGLRVDSPYNEAGGTVTISIHRLVMLVFHYYPGCEEMQVNHIDGNKLNSYEGNLEWCTCQENIDHAYKMGLAWHPSGEDCSAAIITNAQADEVGRLLAENKYDHPTIAKMTGTTISIVHNISGGSSWKDVYEKYDLVNRPPTWTGAGYPDEEVERMCQYFEQNAPLYSTMNDLFSATMRDLYGIEYDRYNMGTCMRSYFHGKTRKYITQKYHPILGGPDR